MKPFEDYKSEVLQAYNKGKAEGSLPANVKNHTPANLKKECINEFHLRYSEQVAEIFKSFFGSSNSKEEYYQKIKNSDPDIFRPLNYFLNGTILKTKQRNIYLLAWLIDFEPSPIKPKPHNPIQRIITWILKKFKFNKFASKTAISVLSGLIIWYIITRPISMYWNGNEYLPLSFYQEAPGFTIVKIDPYRLEYLKKITNIKLITRKHIGKIYYSKIKGKVEFYTIRGVNPEDTTKDLRPMSEWMYNEHVLKKLLSKRLLSDHD